jgi:hypothetical protein
MVIVVLAVTGVSVAGFGWTGAVAGAAGAVALPQLARSRDVIVNIASARELALERAFISSSPSFGILQRDVEFAPHRSRRTHYL